MTLRTEHRFINSALAAALSVLLLTGPCFQSAAHTAAKGTAAHKSDLHALTRITGIVRYYSPNPYTAGWNSFDWFFIEYSRFKALEQRC